MDLFVINRYNEADDKETPNKTYDHLSELLKKIELRKKLREKSKELNEDNNSGTPSNANDQNDDKNTSHDDNNTEKDDNCTKKPSSKKRKRKLRTQNELSSNSVNDDEIDNMPDNCSSECQNTMTNDSSNAGIVQNTKNMSGDPQNNEKLVDFMILGPVKQVKKQKVKEILPKWLAKPEIISADLNQGPELEKFTGLLDDQLIQVLRANGINKLFPVQEKLINWMIKCNDDRKSGWWTRDTCVSAPTGSGKTLAYVLPIIQHLKGRLTRAIRCLIVLPVQELAAQVYKVMTTYSAQTDLKVGLISGASSLEIEQAHLFKKSQRGQYINRVHILIATPGRLIDHIEKTNGFSLANLEFLVIDEADRATDWLNYIPEPHRCAPLLTTKNLCKHVIPPAQKLLFSATLSQDPEKLSRLGLFNPILFTSVSVTDRTDEDVDLDKEIGEFIGKYTSPHELIERAVECPPEYKPIALWKLITSQETIDKTLVFTNSGKSAHRLSILLTSIMDKSDLNTFGIGELSAQLMPKQRIKILEKFITGENKVLISSDALARGLDITGVKLVVSYDLPKYVKSYIHRIGRTGRAGVPGTAVSILTPNQIPPFTKMLSSAHKVIPTIEHLESSVESIAEVINYPSHLNKLKETVESEHMREMEKKRNAKRPRLINNIKYNSKGTV